MPDRSSELGDRTEGQAIRSRIFSFGRGRAAPSDFCSSFSAVSRTGHRHLLSSSKLEPYFRPAQPQLLAAASVFLSLCHAGLVIFGDSVMSHGGQSPVSSRWRAALVPSAACAQTVRVSCCRLDHPEPLGKRGSALLGPASRGTGQAPFPCERPTAEPGFQGPLAARGACEGPWKTGRLLPMIPPVKP